LHWPQDYHARGKVLGGSSSIKGMIFQRGNPLDYERWAADPGMETWDYAHCLPYFKRMETLPRGDRTVDFAGRGPPRVERGPATSRCSARSFEACSRRLPLTTT
jgi:choline dehydrogenase